MVKKIVIVGIVLLMLVGIFGCSSKDKEESRKDWVIPEPKIKTGYLAKYAKLVSSADKGAILG